MISIELEKEEIDEVCNKAISNENNGKDNWKGLYGSWYSTGVHGKNHIWRV